MVKSSKFRDIDFGGPATYRIVVQGSINEDWSDQLAGMTITTTTGESGKPRTTLVGRIRDQAELSGVLDALYSLHMPIVRIEECEEQE